MNPSDEILECPQRGLCGGCPAAEKTRFEQKREKISSVKTLATEPGWVDLGGSGLRDRADLIWENQGGSMRLGLYALNPELRQIVDLPACPMMSPALEAWFKEFREKAPSIRKGSVRLRVSPSGERGVWLDFANQDVKTLFEEKDYLKWLSSKATVEIGQRRKVLYWKDGAPKLADPELKPWFETYDPQGQSIPLYGPVGGFSQAGFKANRALVTEVSKAVKAAGLNEWLELFCGNGNFTLALAAAGYSVEAVEMDELAVEGLKRSTEGQPWAGRLKIHRADVYLKTGMLPAFKGRGLLVDPPRAGLREVLVALAKLPHEDRPPAIAYVSCFTEALLADAKALQELGYRLRSLTAVEQFPHSAHSEWVSLFTF